MSSISRRSQIAGTAAVTGMALAPRFHVRSVGAQSYELTWAVNNFAASEVELVQQVVDNFVAANPEYSVSVLGYDPNTYDQKLLTDIVAGTLPDIFVSADIFTKPFFDQGLTADLKPFMEQTGPKIEDFDPKFIELAIYQDKVGFLPRAGDVVVLYYNKRLFDEAGLDYPADDWTWTDLLTAAEQLTVKAADGTTTQYGFTADYPWWAFWVPLVVAEGGQILSQDNQEILFNSPEGIRAWDIIFTGLKDGTFVPPSVQTTMGGPSVPFSSGRAAMTATIRAAVPGFRDQLEDDFDVALMPAGSVTRKTGMGTMGYAMSAQTDDPDATWKLLHYLFTDGMKVFMESYLLVPPITSFYDDPTWRDLPAPPSNNQVFVDSFEIAMLPPKLDFYSTGPFNQAMTDGVDAVLLGNMTTEEAVNRMAEAATQALQG